MLLDTHTQMLRYKDTHTDTFAHRHTRSDSQTTNTCANIALEHFTVVNKAEHHPTGVP